MKIIVHGGMHKAGSTALQRLLSSHRTALMESGYFYPSSTSGHHGPLLNVRRTDWSPTGLAHQIAVAADQKMHTVIFSGETVSTFQPESFKALHQCFQGLEVSYVFGFRHWCEYWPSRWAQDCLRRDAHSFAAYLDALRISKTDHMDTRFDLILSRASKGTGAEVKAVSFANSIVAGRRPLAEMLAAMTLPDDLIARLILSERIVNPRPDWVTVELLRLLNGLLASRLGARQAPIFQSRLDGNFDEWMFDLSDVIKHYPDSMLSHFKEMIWDNKESIVLKCDDPLIRECNKYLTENCGSFFCNLIDGSVFARTLETHTTFTNLHYRDIAWPELNQIIDGLATEWVGKPHLRG